MSRSHEDSESSGVQIFPWHFGETTPQVTNHNVACNGLVWVGPTLMGASPSAACRTGCKRVSCSRALTQAASSSPAPQDSPGEAHGSRIYRDS